MLLAAAWQPAIHGNSLGVQTMVQERRFQRWLPVLLAAGAMAGMLLLWQALSAQNHAQIRRAGELKTAAVRDVIQSGLEARIEGLNRMGRRWELRGQPPRNEWEQDAGLYLKHYAGYQAIEWVDPAQGARWIVAQPGSTEPPTPPDPASEQRRQDALRAAMQRRSATLSQAILLTQGERGFLACVPLFPNQQFGGILAGTFRIKETLDAILRAQLRDQGYAVAVFAGEEQIYTAAGTDASEADDWRQEARLDLPGAAWRVQVWPTRDHLATTDSALPEVTLVLGVLLSLLLGFAAHFALTARRQRRELELVNQDLTREIAERKRAQEAEERHAAELARSNAELQQFAYVASHDLQEPLRIVSGYVQLLAKRYRGKLDSDADEFIGYAADGATRMQALIGDLLAYSRVGSREKVLVPLDCEAVLSQTLANLKAGIEESGAVVTHDPLPRIEGDRTQISQLFLNLIGNAIKYRSATPPRIHVSAQNSGDHWLFSVRDNGIGIDPRHAERIFIIFQRLHGKGKYSGTGIGLAICKKVVENHGGRIWVESQPGQGATFYFTIPSKRG